MVKDSANMPTPDPQSSDELAKEALSSRLHIRVTPSAKANWKKAAAKCPPPKRRKGSKLSSWAIAVLNAAAGVANEAPSVPSAENNPSHK